MSSPTYAALAATPVLAGLGPEALALLDAEGKLRKFAAGEIIVREGEPGHAFFIIVEGDVEVVKRHGQPDAFLLARLHRGTFFGEMCVVDPVPRAATVCAMGEVTAIEIRAGTLYHLFVKMPAQYSIVILNLARDMARRLRLCDEAFAARAS